MKAVLEVIACLLLTVFPLEAQTSSPGADGGSDLDGERVRTVFDDVMSAPDYRRLHEAPASGSKNILQRFFEWLEELFERPSSQGGGQSFRSRGSGGGGFGTGAFQILLWVLLGVAGAVLLAYIVRAATVRSRKSSDDSPRTETTTIDDLAPTTPPGSLPTEEYLRRALQLADDGDHRRALRQLVLGGMSWIERAGLVRYRQGLTNRDYVRAVWQEQEQRNAFRGIVGYFERVYFGRRPATADRVDTCVEHFRRVFSVERSPAEGASPTRQTRTSGGDRDA